MIIQNDKYIMQEYSNVYYSVYMKLTICRLSKADLGGYKCISKNSIGDAEGSIRIYEVDLSKRKHLLDVTAKSSNHNRILSEIEFEIEGVGGSDGDRNGSSLYIDIIEPNRAAGVKSRWVMLVLCSLLMRRWW
ncbi:hypothetical protein M8J76_003283 [Diaphorina citri]|nr:hypothetical protein M8J75_011901 [Diaphorina citri]KAI5699144.1 hypothetical protein M8J77_003550 [Diaphorina citri]KAI5723239.1 hypothetical protein M8J76_003283 [Diaphorina citri]KAI5728261.1 hypothetical protein M8J77_013738 [Diaphorina citri]